MRLAKRYNPAKVEPRIQRFWAKNKIFRFDPRSRKPVYSIDTPPPTISGKLHMGHMMHYTQFDFIAYYKRMSGFNVFYPFCFDDNGLPTERYVEETMRLSKASVTKGRFRKLCLSAADKLIKEYLRIMTKLGHCGDLNLTYRTIDRWCQRQAQRSFIDLYKKDQVYLAEEPTIWCPYHQTALAQAVVEDLERTTSLNYVDFQLIGGGKITIATTRPELLPACVGVFVHPDDRRHARLAGEKAKVPIFGQIVRIRTDPAVDPAFGTGIVMVCTFGDRTDIEWWRRHKLPLRMCIGKDGRLTDIAGRYAGLPIQDARSQIIADLKAAGLLRKSEPLRQTVGACWRCATPVEFIITKQWFIKTLEHRNKLLELGAKLRWYPAYYQRRYEDWVKGLAWNWCISRQRYFGIPIPVWYCKGCGAVLLPKDRDLPVDPERDRPKPCSCGSRDFEPEHDVFDTWMTSSITPLINAKWREDMALFKKIFPMSLRPQGHDIIRTWAFYTILKSYLHLNKLPWRDVMISGHGLDPYGRKMSKKLGNIVEPLPLIEKYGADAVRLWATSASLGEDLPFKEKDVQHGRRVLIKLWNAARLSSSYIPRGRARPALKAADRWILGKLAMLIKEYHRQFAEYEISKARAAVESFFMREFCDFYLEMAKHRLYGKDRAAAWTVSYGLLSVIKLFAPFIPHITEEIYQKLFREGEKAASVHISGFPYPVLPDRKALRAGEMAKAIISMLRGWKHARRLPLNAPLTEVLVQCDRRTQTLLRPLLPDIAGTMNIQAVRFGKGELPVPATAIRLSIKA